ncbi:MAG: 4-(cytidine 5'-diphospho)-2-C-methyl-D-erythritol kinase [Actinomycetota bacterium]|jgi:4-diphosphocytidyl-2-C-methyl-D-erythritol kinase|nr:4-(cytidine 5'-diphospho)-2-C-methyl-D-erythritol kinase [Actinomycetota bacterium]
METAALLAPAKLTVSLRVTGVRDDGYHLIDAEMVSLDLCDELVIEETPAPGQLDIIDAGSGLEVGAGQDNLVSRALELLGRHADVRLLKRIPAGAGLGGGSSDAAAVLRWGGGVSANAAAGIGADVAFCQVGGRARVTGIGEVIEPLAHRPGQFTLLTPPFGVSTPVVYRTWDALGGPVGDGGNDLEPAALAAYPELAGWRDALTDATGRRARLAGSGGTWFVDGAFERVSHDGTEARVVSTVGTPPAAG